MRLSVTHQTTYRYDAGSNRVTMLLKLKPRTHEGQVVERWRVTVNGETVEKFGPNGAGDLEALWVSGGRIDSATIIAEGIVSTSDLAGVMRGLPPGSHPLVYLRETPFTALSDPMRAVLAKVPEGDALSRLHALAALVRDQVKYEPGATGQSTTAEEAFVQGKGVCQDFAQIFIAMARGLDLPARYVTGYMLAAEGADALHETHGWAEAMVPDLGWIGFDVANAMCVTDRYIRLASGLDAHDAAPIRGTALSSGAIHIDADVLIDQSEEEVVGSGIRQTQRQNQGSAWAQSQAQRQQ